MKVIVAGAGLVGSNIARYLAAAGNDVTLIDQRGELVRKLEDNLDIQAMIGHAAHPESLMKAGAADADMLIAVTQVDEVNMVACQVAHSLFNVPTKIARVRQQAYLTENWGTLFDRDHIPIDFVISPEVEVAHAIARRLEIPGALTVVSFLDQRIRLLGFRCTGETPVVHTPLRQLSYLFPDLHLVCVGIVRGGKFFVPGGDDQMLPDDDVLVVVENAHLDRTLSAFGIEDQMGERIIIVGGGNVGLFLAQELEERYPHLSLKLIEFNQARATLVAEQLTRTVVLCGDARERDLLEEANVRASHSIVTVTNDDEVNIIAGLLARRLGCSRSLALVNNSNYNILMDTIGIDVAINPREITVSSVLQHVKRGRLGSVHTIRDGEAEIFEAEALETSQIVDKPLRSLRLSGVIIGAIVRDGKMITPRGDTVVQAHDRLVVLARSDMSKKVEQLFAVRPDYF
ncbi:MAG: Trk system potassium transporter TrkA [Geminicoccaceae bacterium]|nr:Trk system potassium transporter TrkA [Geminicoccaceae bacterium]MCB9945273.1 Trk system potassium transporter TrkA [Geminicoccaceae bacterium]